MKREDLAINKYKNEIIEIVKKNPVVVIEAPTGSIGPQKTMSSRYRPG